jgi:hypothetical protein
VNENVNANDLSLDSLEIDPGLDSPWTKFICSRTSTES